MDVKYINHFLEGTINGEIRDAVGEITNMVSGAARKKIEAMYQPICLDSHCRFREGSLDHACARRVEYCNTF